MTTKENQKLEEDWQVRDDNDSHDDPLVDCLEILSTIYERTTSRTVLRAGLPLVQDRLTVELVPRAASRAGLSTRILKKKLETIHNLELPAILLLEDRRACIVLEIIADEGLIKVIWPESGGKETLEISKISSSYTGYAIFVKPKFMVDDRASKKPGETPKNWFWKTIFSSWKIYRDVVVASFLINLFALATPIFIINAYDRIIPNAAFETLWVLSSGVAIIYLFELLLRGLRGFFIDSAGKRANLILSSMLMEKVFSLRMEMRPKSVGSFTKKLQQFEAIRDFITSFSIAALIDMPFAFLALAAIWYIAPPLIWIHITCIILIVLYALAVQIPLKKSVTKSFKADAQKNAVLVEGLNGMETIKTLGAESAIQRAWEESVSYIANWSARTRFLSSSVNHLSNFFQNLSVVAVIIVSVYLISEGVMSGGGLIACVILTRRAITPMTQVVNLMTRFHQARNSLATLNKIMALPSERPAEKIFLHRVNFEGEVNLQNLSFSYPGTQTDILRNINIEIKPGEKVGIIGPIGSGKTTLGKLMLGLYEPTHGMVAMDGTDIRQIDPAELRKFIGYVPQDVVLFRGTVRDNILLGTNGIDDETMVRAADIAGMNQFINKSPLGFDMLVEEQGKNLSGGQRQSIAIARAILLDPPILILDEPTSSMDNRSEAEIREKLSPTLQNKTTIIITHRVSLLSLVDRIIVMANECVVADGTKQRILEALKNGHLAI